METITGKSPDSESTYILKDKSPSQDSGHPSQTTEDSRQLVDDEMAEKKKVQSNIPFTSFNFINSIVGSGIIGIPYAINQAGFGLGIILLVLVAVVTDYSILMLIEAGHLTNLNTYQDVVKSAFGRPVFYLLTFLQFVYPFIAMVSYNVIIGDTITRLLLRVGGASLVGTVLGNRQFVILMVTLLITLPLSLYKNIARLSKWAFLSIFLVLVILVFVLIRVPDFAETIPTRPESFIFARANVTQAIGIMAFAFMCHHNVFLIHESLENNTSKRWKIVTHSSFIVSLIIMMVIGVSGYVTFKTFTQGDLLESYCHYDDLANTGRLLFAITIMLTYPIECFVTREVLELSVFANRQASNLRHIAVTVTIAILSAAISITTDCLGIVLELNGVLVACPLAFIIPSILVVCLRGQPYFSWRNVIPTLIFLFGVFVCVVGTVTAIMNVILQKSACNHGVEPIYCLKYDTVNGTIFSSVV